MSEPTTSPVKPKKQRRTWKQRIRLTAIVLVVVVLLIRAAVNMLLPTVVRKVANAYELDCAYDRMSLNLISGNANIWGLALRPKAGGDSIVRADFIHGSVSVPNLLRGRLVVYRAEVDGVDMLIDREPDGGIPLLKQFGSATPAPPPPPAKVASSGKAEPLSLQAPLRIDAVRLSHVSTTFRDRSVSPTFQTTVRTTFRLSDVGSTDQPAKLELEVDADPVLDSLLVQGVVHNTPTSVDADVNLQLRGVHPKPAAAYLAPLGVKPIAEDITVKGRATVKINAIPNTTDFAGQIAVTDIAATANSAEWASLKGVTIDVRKLNTTTLELASVHVDQGRAAARRNDAGHVQIAGFELVPVTGVAAPPPPSTRPAAVSVATSGGPAFRASLDELKLTDLQASFDDQAVRPAADLVARLDELTVKNVILDPAQPDATAKISGTATVPGVVKAITWAGTATPFAATRKAELFVRAGGIQPTALKPYLDTLGVTSDLVNGVFTANVTASSGQTTDAKLTDIKLSDGVTTLLELPTASVKGFAVAGDGAIRVQAIDVTGPTVGFRREADGSLTGVGLRIKPTTQPSVPVAAAPTTQPVAKAPSAPKPAAKITLPRIQLDRLTWKEIRLNFNDRRSGGDAVALQGTAGVELSDFVLDSATTRPARPGRFKAWLEAPGIAERLAVNDGTLTPTPDGLLVTAGFTGQGITGQAIGSYLKPLGIELLLKNGQVQGNLAASIGTSDAGLKAKLDLTDVSYADGESELAGVGEVHVAGVEYTPDRISVGSVQIVKPRARVTRNADGTLQAGGVRLLPPPPATQPAALPTGPTPPAPLSLAASPVALTLKQFSLEEGVLQITDNAVAPPLNTAVRGSVKLDNAGLSPKDPPATLDVTGAIDGIIQKAIVSGTLSLAPDAPGAKLTITADQIKTAVLSAYLPPGVVGQMQSGHFNMAIDAGASNHPQGGIAAHLAVSDLSLDDNNTPLAKVGAFTVRAGRLDPAGQILAVDEISSAGVRLDVARNADGTIDALGLRLGAKTKPAQLVAAVTTQPATQPAVAVTTQPAVDVAALVADARRPLPLVTVGKIDLQLDSLRVSGAAGPDGKPLHLHNVRLHNLGPVELAGPGADQRPPLVLRIDGVLAPVMENFTVKVEAAPFASEPSLDIDIAAGGINGEGLTDVVPELAKTIEGKGLTSGVFVAHLTASLNYGRRGPRDLDLGRGFVAQFTLKPCEYRGEDRGPILAGVEEVHGEGIKVEPAKGNVIIKSIDVTRPIGRFVRDEKGLHALGFVIPLAATTQPTTEPTTPPAQVAAATPAAPPPPVERPKGEFRIDRFTVTGIDLLVEDRSTPPATVIPLKTLDLDVRDLSNQMAWTGKPLRFDLLCTADRVPLPPRKGARATGPTTQTAEGEGEMRELFSQVTANGQVWLKQMPDGRIVPVGWAKTGVNGFELLGVRGLAKAQKVEIGGGVFDDSNDIRFKQDGSIETRNRIVFTNLSLDEPADGPIRAALKLPTPIDAAINLMKDADDSITMDVPVTIEQGAVDTSSVIGPAIGAVSKVVLTAIASAPVKVVGGVGGMMGLGKGEKMPEPPVVLSFLPGVATLEGPQRQELVKLAERLKDDKDLEVQLRHTFSQADIDQLQRRANPAAGDVRLITDQLRRARADLVNQRLALAAQAKAQFASQSTSAEGTVTSIQAVDRKIAQIDNALDQFYDLLRPGASSQVDRRTKAACLSVAGDRFELIQLTLSDLGVKDVATRVHRTNPQFDPSGDRGVVTITLVPKKH